MATVNQTLTVAQRERSLRVASKINTVLVSMADNLQSLQEDGEELAALLAEARQIVPHGQWQQWVRENLDLSLRRVREIQQEYREQSVPHLRRLLDEHPTNGGKTAATAVLPPAEGETEEDDDDVDSGDMVGSDDEDWDDDESKSAEDVDDEDATDDSEEAGVASPEPAVSRAPMQSVLSIMRTLKRTLGEAKVLPGGEALGQAWTRCLEKHSSYYSFLAALVPHAVCPECEGSPVDCRVCRDRGWVGESTYQQYSEERRARVPLID